MIERRLCAARLMVYETEVAGARQTEARFLSRTVAA